MQKKEQSRPLRGPGGSPVEKEIVSGEIDVHNNDGKVFSFNRNVVKNRRVQKNMFVFQNIDEPYGVAGWMSGLEQLGVDSTGQPILNRRGSQQGLEPEPPPDESNLRRAISCESVCSDTSVNLGDLENATMVGHVCVGLEYERWGGRGADCEGDLAVSVLEARDLVAPDGRPAQDTLAR